MAQKLAYIDGIGDVTLAKRRGTRNLRLSINPSGRIRVGLPYWLPYKAATAFAKSRRDWIAEQQVLNQHALLRHGLKIGKAHRLYFNQEPDAQVIKTRVDKISVRISSPYDEQDSRLQVKARAACEKALASEARTILPQRLKTL